MLRVWFSCGQVVSSERDVKITALLEFCTKDKQRAIVRILVSEGMKGAEIHWLQIMDRTVCHSEVCTSKSKCLKTAEPMLMMQTCKDDHPHPQRTKHGACSSNDSWKL
jgi:hypothetical protein